MPHRPRRAARPGGVCSVGRGRDSETAGRAHEIYAAAQGNFEGAQDQARRAGQGRAKEKARIIAKLAGMGLAGKDGEAGLDQMTLEQLKGMDEQMSNLFGPGGGLGNLFGGMGGGLKFGDQKTGAAGSEGSTGDTKPAEEEVEVMDTDHDEV